MEQYLLMILGGIFVGFGATTILEGEKTIHPGMLRWGNRILGVILIAVGVGIIT